MDDVIGDDVGLQREAGGRTHVTQLLADDGVEREIKAGAAIGFRDLRTEQAGCAHFFPSLALDDAVALMVVEARLDHVDQHAADLEGPARRLRRARAAEEALPIVEQTDPPRVADLVLVDLVLDLDPAVLRRGLQLPVRAPAAVALADHVGVVRERRGCRRHQRRSQQRRHQDLDPLRHPGSLRRRLVRSELYADEASSRSVGAATGPWSRDLADPEVSLRSSGGRGRSRR